MESGSPNSFPAVHSSVRQPTYDAIIQQVGCRTAKDSLSCLRKAPLATLSAANTFIQSNTLTNYGTGGFAFGPVIDGKWIKSTPDQIIKKGQWAKVVRLANLPDFPIGR